MTTLGYRVLDVFTDRRLGGNPLAVVMNGEVLADARMQAIAREFNLSETVFMLPAEHPDAAMRLRIFTPWEELPFAGHPVIGAACALAMIGLVPPGSQLQLGLQTRLGVVPVRLGSSPQGAVQAELETPQAPVFGASFEAADALAACLGLDRAALAGPDRPARTVSCGLPILLVPLRGPEHLAGIGIDRVKLADVLRRAAAHSLYAFAPGYEGPWRCRMFNPQLGEDPATGAAAAALAAHLADLQAGEGDWAGDVSQGLEIGRPSRIRLRARRHAGQVGPVWVGGDAVLAMEGHLHVD